MTTQINYQTSNLTLNTAGARIIVPHSTTASDRLIFQTNNTNGASYFSIAPSGTNTQSFFQLFGSSTATDCPILNMFAAGDLNTVFLESTGTGTYTPSKIQFEMEGYPALTYGTNGKVGIGLQDQASNANAGFVLNVCSGHNLGAALADEVYIARNMCGVDDGTSYSVNLDSRGQLYTLFSSRTAASSGGSGDWITQSTGLAYVVDGVGQGWIYLNYNTEGSMSFQTSASSASWVFTTNYTGYVGPGLYFVTQAVNSSSWYGMTAYSSTGTDAEFYVRGDGEVRADGSIIGGGADYAEMFEWEDQNPDNEDRRGISVVLVGEYVRPATDLDSSSDIIGAVSSVSSLVGNDPMKWKRKYIRDEYGAEIRDENGHRILNPEFDPEQEYIKRSDRPEWAAIGLLGKIYVRKGQPVNPKWKKIKSGVGDKPDYYLVR